MDPIRPASRFDSIEISLIRQVNAAAAPGAIDLGLGEPNLALDATFLEMAREAAAMPWRYTPNAGLPPLRTAIAATLGHQVDPDKEICVTAGTEEGLFAVVQAFVNPGDEVLVPDPGFVSYPALVRIAGATPVPYTFAPDWSGIDEGALQERIGPRTRAIIVNSPSNPTGAVLSDESLAAIARIARDAGLLVVSDEVYREIHYGERPASMLGRGEHVVVVGGMSKSHAMTGLRLGWAIASAEIMKTFVKAHQYIATCASAFSQHLASLVFANAEWNASWLDRARSQLGVQRETALAALRDPMRIDLAPPGGAFYLFVPIEGQHSLPLARSLASEGRVVVIPGIAFGEKGEGYLRVSYAAELGAIREGIRRLGEAVTG